MGKKIAGILLISATFLFVAASRDRKKEEIYRPQFHFSPEKNWMNDPNGLFWLDGHYHLFYQYNPHDTVWGDMHWGHAVSADLLHWQHKPVALTPDSDEPDNKGDAWSGTAIVDARNAAGFGSNSAPIPLLFYTSFQNGQRMAYSADNGDTWTKYEHNPVLPTTDDSRDPKVFFYEPANKYVMTLWQPHSPELPADSAKNQEDTQGFAFYSSTDMKSWKFESFLPGFYECPDIVELPVDGTPEKHWVLFNGDGNYCIGDFDGHVFAPKTPLRKSDFGANYYATQTWNNIPATDGRTLQIAWMRDGEFPGAGFCGQMSFPCEISLLKSGESLQLLRKPAREIELLHKRPQVWENKTLIPGLNKTPVQAKGDCFHIIGTFDINNVSSFGFVVAHSRTYEGVEIRYDATKYVLSCMSAQVKLIPEDTNIITLEILLDRTSIEIFANNGKTVITNAILQNPAARNVTLYNTGGELIIKKLEIYPLRSIYE
ncbi:MAG: glycoside hydrolase family 32 protein [Bacteroidales bacterium]|jgi:sucrose-6-phosphate hydrolase SacC (GH32 family)|nr:glycoside hydrolase family 32 protein [Bacteroidales bacterium]